MKDLFIISLLLLLTLATGLLWAFRYMESSEKTQTYKDLTAALIRCESAAKACTNKEFEAKQVAKDAARLRDEVQAIHDCLKPQMPTIQAPANDLSVTLIDDLRKLVPLTGRGL